MAFSQRTTAEEITYNNIILISSLAELISLPLIIILMRTISAHQIRKHLAILQAQDDCPTAPPTTQYQPTGPNP